MTQNVPIEFITCLFQLPLRHLFLRDFNTHTQVPGNTLVDSRGARALKFVQYNKLNAFYNEKHIGTAGG